jgi:hypothetical protein
MDNREYVKMDCPACDGSIEYPADAAGEKIVCPHCGNLIQLGSNRVWAQAPPRPSQLTRKQTRASDAAVIPSTPLGCFGALLKLVLILTCLTLVGSIIEWFFTGKIGQSYPRSRSGAESWKTEIRAGVNAYDPTWKLTPEDERLLRSAAEEANRVHRSPK